MYTFSAIVRLEYWPKPLKVAQIIMIPKTGKNPKDLASYCQVSLLSINSKVPEKFYSKI